MGTASPDSYLRLPRKNERHKFAEELLRFAREQSANLKGDGGEVFSPPFGSRVLDKYVRQIELWRFDGYDWVFGSGRANTQGLSEQNWVCHVERKAQKLSRALANLVDFDEFWLLVVGGIGTRGSQSMAVTPGFFEQASVLGKSLKESPFSRFIVWEHVCPGRLWEWVRDQGWREERVD